MRSRNSGDDATVGEDSFLDTTANLVGILIILVVIIGSKTKADAESYSRQLSSTDRSQELEEPRSKLASVESSLVDQLINTQEYELEIEYRRAERQRLLDEVVLAREAVAEKLETLDEAQRETIEEDAEIDKLKSEIDKVISQSGAVDQTQRPPILLEHLPTPMARTVFQKEVHVMLKDGRVTVIPWDRLIETLKQQIPLAAQRQASRNKLEDRIGPISGFVLMYRMAAIPGGFELDRFELDPTPSVPSEPVSEAFGPSSRLSAELATRNARETVVTVWVYPSSFDHFRQLKGWLFAQGFLCAARPLPDGVRVGGSPQGSRSSAQ